MATKDYAWLAIFSMALGALSLCAWFLPVCGLPVSAAGMILGFLGKDSTRRTLALAGFSLSGLGLAASVINAAVGAYLGATGQLFQ